MAVYFDEPRQYGWGPKVLRAGSSHLWADSEQELRDFAQRLGLKASWIQRAGTRHVHFDVSPRWLQPALTMGAIRMERREWLKAQRTPEAT